MVYVKIINTVTLCLSIMNGTEYIMYHICMPDTREGIRCHDWHHILVSYLSYQITKSGTRSNGSQSSDCRCKCKCVLL